MKWTNWSFRVWMFTGLLLLAIPVGPLAGQAPPKKPSPAPLTLHYTIKQMQGNTLLNSRTYVIHTTNLDQASLNVRNRVPVRLESGKGGSQIDFINTGLQINAGPYPVGDKISLRSNIELTNFVAAGDGKGTANIPPIERHLSFMAVTLVQPGQLARLGTMDDVATHQRFEFDVLAEVPTH